MHAQIFPTRLARVESAISQRPGRRVNSPLLALTITMEGINILWPVLPLGRRAEARPGQPNADQRSQTRSINLHS